MKLSIVIICWNDRVVLEDCLRSIYTGTHSTEFEVIISDNGSEDDSLDFVRTHYPQAKIVENGANIGFARGNNAGAKHATGEYFLILNPDTIVHDGALDRWVQFADQHPEAGAFGCRVLNPDGSYQNPAWPFPTPGRFWIGALYLRPLGRLSEKIPSDTYLGWSGKTTREIDWQCGCSVLVRGEVFNEVGGFDEQFFYHFEEVDLCRRIWDRGHKIIYTPDVEITHLGGQSVGRFPIRFELEKYRNRYRYFYKHFGADSVYSCRRAALTRLFVRRLGYGMLSLLKPKDRALGDRMNGYRVAQRWHRELEPKRFVEEGVEPDVGYEPIVPAKSSVA